MRSPCIKSFTFRNSSVLVMKSVILISLLTVFTIPSDAHLLWDDLNYVECQTAIPNGLWRFLGQNGTPITNLNQVDRILYPQCISYCCHGWQVNGWIHKYIGSCGDLVVSLVGPYHTIALSNQRERTGHSCHLFNHWVPNRRNVFSPHHAIKFEMDILKVYRRFKLQY